MVARNHWNDAQFQNMLPGEIRVGSVPLHGAVRQGVGRVNDISGNLTVIVANPIGDTELPSGFRFPGKVTSAPTGPTGPTGPAGPTAGVGGLGSIVGSHPDLADVVERMYSNVYPVYVTCTICAASVAFGDTATHKAYHNTINH
jgi:hypothetical protein